MKRIHRNSIQFILWGLGFLGYALCFMFVIYLFNYFTGKRDINLYRALIGPVIGIFCILIYKKFGNSE